MWSIYEIKTGLFTGARFRLHAFDQKQFDQHLKEGEAALEGEFDHLSQKIEHGEVVNFQPPQPKNNSHMIWEWDAGVKRWAPRPTDLSLAEEARLERDKLLAACDWVVAKSMELQEPIPAAYVTYRKALRELTEQPGFPRRIEWPALTT